jgi:hypothetical protein
MTIDDTQKLEGESTERLAPNLSQGASASTVDDEVNDAVETLGVA